CALPIWWNSLFPERLSAWRGVLAAKLRTLAETVVLPGFLAERRWFADKGAPLRQVRLHDHAEWRTREGHWLFAIFEAQSAARSAQYFLPLGIAFEDAEEARWKRLQSAAIARVRQRARIGVLADATVDEAFCRALLNAIASRDELPMVRGKVRFTPTRAFETIVGELPAELPVGLPQGQGSNTAIRLGERLFLKVYRRLQPGINPEVEVGRFLTEVAQFPHVVPLAGLAQYDADDGTSCALALLQAFVLNQGDGWDYTVNYLTRFLEDTRGDSQPPEEIHGAYLELARVLGTRTAELHCALAHPTDDAAFRSEPIRPDDLAAWRARVRSDAEETLALLANREADLPDTALQEARALGQRRNALLQRIESSAHLLTSAIKIRHHGDYHLGQVLVRRNDFVIVDFEGEPARPLEERRRKHSPLRDVAGMLRSFSYAAHAAWMTRRGQTESVGDQTRLPSSLAAWERAVRATFLAVYDPVARAGGLYGSSEEAQALIDLFEIEKALYEVRYELGNRPDWAHIPIRDLLALTD
ncbi:MAG TPA: putative maltokinase, partial [Steroidobacteraceae bacterium]|nr:putative maltokinase [Steroidobacteraceae bacterium]